MVAQPTAGALTEIASISTLRHSRLTHPHQPRIPNRRLQQCSLRTPDASTLDARDHEAWERAITADYA
jgi:hypothetical protein